MVIDLKALLDDSVRRFNTTDFIATDPISIPKRFTRLQDIEISGFWVAMLAWGQRKTIINSANKLLNLMDQAPYDFVLNHEEKDRARFEEFKHRTFNFTDTLYFLEFFQQYYQRHSSLEQAFTRGLGPESVDMTDALQHFHETFFSLPDAPRRTRKHVSTPARKSTCKRLNMFLRWMVRRDEQGVDFGLWSHIRPDQLLIPLDVHVERVARRFGLLTRQQRDWLAVVELTEALKQFDANDPVKYDFALFGLGVLDQRG